MCERRVGVFKFRQDLFRQDLAKFHAPLVETVDVPNDALGEDLVLVESDELAQGRRRQFFGQKGVGGPVAFESLVRDQFLRNAFLSKLLFRFAEGKGFRLGEVVGHQFDVMVAHGIQGFRETDEVAGDQFRTLMDELIESVLAVGAGLAPDDGAGLVIDFFALLGDVFAVRFHIALLEISGEAGKILVVRQNGLGLGAVEVVVPDAEKSHDDRHILLEGRGAEMLVHFMITREHRFEVLGADGDHKGKADGGAQGIAAAHPVPEGEHVGGVDAEFSYFLGVGGERHEVFRDGFLVAQLFQEPGFGALGVRHRFQRRESLAGDDEERLLGVEVPSYLCDVRAVNVGDEAHR